VRGEGGDGDGPLRVWEPSNATRAPAESQEKFVSTNLRLTTPTRSRRETNTRQAPLLRSHSYCLYHDITIIFHHYAGFWRACRDAPKLASIATTSNDSIIHRIWIWKCWNRPESWWPTGSTQWYHFHAVPLFDLSGAESSIMAQRICQKESLDLIESLSSEREKTVSPILPPSSSRNLLSLSLSSNLNVAFTRHSAVFCHGFLPHFGMLSARTWLKMGLGISSADPWSWPPYLNQRKSPTEIKTNHHVK